MSFTMVVKDEASKIETTRLEDISDAEPGEIIEKK